MKKIVNITFSFVILLSFTTYVSAVEGVITSSGEYLTKSQIKTMDTEKAISNKKVGPTGLTNTRQLKAENTQPTGTGNVTKSTSVLEADVFPVDKRIKLDEGMGERNSRFPSVLAYGEGNTGNGPFGFTDDSAAVWYRPVTDATVTGFRIYIHDESELVGTDVTVQLRDVLDVTSTGLTANGVHDFTIYNATIGNWLGAELDSKTFSVTSSDVYPAYIELNFDTPIDVGTRDFALSLAIPGGGNADLRYYDGINGAGIPYNHGIKWYHTGASYCSEGCWVPRLNFLVWAYVDYYGDPPPSIADVEDLSDVFASCDVGPYESTAEITDMGTAEFQGALTDVLFIYDAGMGPDTTDLLGTGVNDIFTGSIPSQPVGTTISYYWVATDNGDENPDTSAAVKHTTDLVRAQKHFTIQEHTDLATVLIVDDTGNELDGTSPALDVLDAAYEQGFISDYWNTFDGGTMTLCELEYYSTLVFVLGDNGAGIVGDGAGSFSNDVLMSYLDAGGNLLISAPELWFGLTGNGWQDDWVTVDAATYPFIANYLAVDQIWSDANYDTSGVGTAMDTLYQGINDGNVLTSAIDSFEVHSPSGRSNTWSDEAFATAEGADIFNVYSEADGDFVPSAGVTHEIDAGYKTIFLPWYLDGIETADVLDEFMWNTMVWFGEATAPVVHSVTGTSDIMFTSDPIDITAIVTDNDGDAFTVALWYSIDGADEVEVAMTAVNDSTFVGDIPGVAGGIEVEYYVTATDASGTYETEDFGYFVYAPESDVLFILNNEMDAGDYPGLYYLYDAYVTSDLFYWPDFWETAIVGNISAELLAFYSTVIEINSTGTWANAYGFHASVILPWLEEGNKNYVCAGDELLGLYTDWEDVSWPEGSFFYEMGVDSTFQDIAVGGVSQLVPVEGDPISGALFTALGDDTLLYDPDNEIDLTNYLDAFIPTADAVVSFTEDTSGRAVGVHKEWANGTKTVFLGFDPLSLNGAPYKWWGATEEGALKQALNWFGITDPPVGVDGNVSALPTSYALHQNYPNPFNPVTNLQFDLPVGADVRLVIYNLLGQKVTTLMNRNLQAGYHNILWNGRDELGKSVSSGVYIYQITTGDFTSSKKMLLLK